MRLTTSPLRQWTRCIQTASQTKDALRVLLRETAQPVAVVTSHYPSDGGDTHSTTSSKFHGATLSSFTSISMDPHPLVAFSLRIPSRMASALKQLMSEKQPCMVINLLSASQHDAALRFSRADLYPEPFRNIPHEFSEEGLPILSGSLGALSCTLVSCTPLHNICGDEPELDEGHGIISELFISRVIRVESKGTKFGDENVLPLLYHRRQYATTRPLEKS